MNTGTFPPLKKGAETSHSWVKFFLKKKTIITTAARRHFSRWTKKKAVQPSVNAPFYFDFEITNDI